MEAKLIDWERRPFVTAEEMATYVARDRKTAATYGEKVLAVQISNRDFQTRFHKAPHQRRMQDPPSAWKHIFIGWLVIRKLGTPEEYETWMSEDVFDELYRPASIRAAGSS